MRNNLTFKIWLEEMGDSHFSWLSHMEKDLFGAIQQMTKNRVVGCDVRAYQGFIAKFR